jgi:hypothetical protein
MACVYQSSNLPDEQGMIDLIIKDSAKDLNDLL